MFEQRLMLLKRILKNSSISRALWLFSKFNMPLKFQLCIFASYFVPGREKFANKLCQKKKKQSLAFYAVLDLFWHLAGMLVGSPEYQLLSGLQDGDAVYRPPLACRLWPDPAFPDQLQSQSLWSPKSKYIIYASVIICSLIPNVLVFCVY